MNAKIFAIVCKQAIYHKSTYNAETQAHSVKIIGLFLINCLVSTLTYLLFYELYL